MNNLYEQFLEPEDKITLLLKRLETELKEITKVKEKDLINFDKELEKRWEEYSK